MIDLSKEVLIKGKRVTYIDYCESMKKEIQETFEFYQKNPKRKLYSGLTQKVDSKGQYKPFYGDTVVFKINKESKLLFKKIQESIIRKTPDYFASNLNPDYFHITLHDLNNDSEDLLNKKTLEREVKKTDKKIKEIFIQINKYIKENPEKRYIELDSIGITSGAFIGLMMAFLPSTEKDYKIIMNLYNLFDEVIYLKKFLRIHLSLNYFNTDDFKIDDIKKIVDCLKVYKDKIHVSLDLYELSYQIFTDMNHYETVFSIKDF